MENSKKERKINIKIKLLGQKKLGRRTKEEIPKRQEEGKENAPLFSTKRNLRCICFVERVKTRSERRNTAILRYGRGRKVVPETDRTTEERRQMPTTYMSQTESETSGMTAGLFLF